MKPPPPPMYFGILAYATLRYARCQGMASTQTALLNVPKFAALSKKVNAVKTESAGATSEIREAPASARRDGLHAARHVLLRCCGARCCGAARGTACAQELCSRLMVQLHEHAHLTAYRWWAIML